MLAPHPQRWPRASAALWWGLAALVLGGAGGVALVALSPLAVFAALAGLGGVALMLRWPQAVLLAFVAVVSLLPFGVVPVRLGVQFTLLDLILALGLLVVVLRVLHRDLPLVATPISGLLLLFIGLASVSFTLGSSFAFSSDLVRYFLKLVNSLLFFFTVAHLVRTRRQLDQLACAVMVCGALEAAIAVALYFLPRHTAVQLLSALRPLGYPSGPEVLRTRPGTDILRAIGTSIDPNLLGGLLMMAAALTIGQLLAPRPLLPRWLLLGLAGPQLLGLALTESRAAWVGLAVAVLFLGTFRYRRAWLLAAVAGLGLALSPQGNRITTRFLEAFGGDDPATALRLVEYRTAIDLIREYPWFGVGFGAGPNVELFLGVSSLYLLIAEEMGLIGLTVFLAMIAVLLVRGLRGQAALRTPAAQGLALTLLSCLAAALASGLFDHYFFRFPHSLALFWLYAGMVWLAVALPEPAPAGSELV